MRSTSRWLTALVVALVAVGSTLALTVGAGAAAPSAVPQVQGIDGTTIKVGGMIDAKSFSGADDGFNARMSRANKDKELGKYTIDYVGTTDVPSTAPDQALSTAQNLVEREQVFAIAPVITTAWSRSAATYAAGKQASYWGAGFGPAWCTPNKAGFSVIGCIAGKYAYTTAQQNLAISLKKPAKGLKVALVGLAVPDGQTTVDTFTKQFKALGSDVVYAKAVIPAGGGGDLQPFVSAVMDTKPDVVWILAGAEVLGFQSAMKAAGYTGALANSAFYVPGLLTKVPPIAAQLDGAYIQAAIPVIESGLPFPTQMVKDYEAIGKKESDISFGGAYAYMTADMLVQGLKKVAPNFDKLIPTLSSSFKYQPLKGGFPMSFPLNYTGPSPCSSTVQVQGQEYVITAPFTCKSKRIVVR